MQLSELAEKLGIKEIVSAGDMEVTGAYTGDLLSDVMAHTKKRYVWVTVQTHVNIIAVASLKELAAIIIASNREMDNETVERATMEKVNLYGTALNSFEVSGRLYELLKGK
jgi:hypothetical protein